MGTLAVIASKRTAKNQTQDRMITIQELLFNRGLDKNAKIKLEGYNKFDVEKMLLDLDNEIIFQNIQKGENNLTLNGSHFHI